MCDFVNPTRVAMHAIVFMAFTNIRPVDDENPAIRAITKLDPPKPKITHIHKIGFMSSNKTVAMGLNPINIDSSAMKVGGKSFALIISGPVIALIDHETTMRMAATRFIGGRGNALAANIAPIFNTIPMIMIRMLINQFEKTRVKMFAKHTLEISPRNRMPEMANHRIDEKSIAIGIPIKSPRISTTPRNYLEDLFSRVITPNPTVNGNALACRGIGSTNKRCGGDAVPAIQPAIRPPCKPVNNIMPDAVVIKPIEDNLGLAIGFVIAIAIRNEKKIRRTKHPDATKAGQGTGKVMALIPKHSTLIMHTIVISIFQNYDAIFQGKIKISFGLGIGKALANPKPAAGIKSHINGLNHLRFMRKHLRLETWWQLDALQRFCRGGKFIFGVLRIGDCCLSMGTLCN